MHNQSNDISERKLQLMRKSNVSSRQLYLFEDECQRLSFSSRVRCAKTEKRSPDTRCGLVYIGPRVIAALNVARDCDAPNVSE